MPNHTPAERQYIMDFGCPNDGSRVAPGRWLCGDCERAYLRLLRDLDGQLKALRSVALRQVRIGAREHAPSNGFAPSPIDWDAQELFEQSCEWMRGVCARLKPEWAKVPLRQWRGLWNRLVANRSTLLTLEDAPEDYAALRELSDRIERRLAPMPELVLWGHCPACDADVMAPRDAKWADCKECGAQLNLAEIRVAYLDAAARTELGGAAREGLHITRTQSGAAEWLSETTGRRFSAQQLAMWRRRGKLPSCRSVGGGYWEWSVRELLACAGGE